MARPKIQIDPNLVDGMASVGCTTEEIGMILGCSAHTLKRRFAPVMKKGRAKLKMSIRRGQVKLANEGHPSMLMFLGKVLLHQNDQPHGRLKRPIEDGKTESEVAAMNATIKPPCELCKG